MLRVVALFFLGLFVGSACFGQGVPYTVGKYTVYVDVRTSLMLIIPHAFIKCKLSGSRLLVSASAPGYVSGQQEIPVHSGTKTYYADLMLRDKEVKLDVRTFGYKPIASCYFERDQAGTPTDKYSVNLFIPIKSWPHPSPANVYMNQPGYGWPIQESCDISIRDDFYRIRMLIMRAFLDADKDGLLVYINTDVVIDKTSAERWFKIVRQLEVGDPAAANDLAMVLFRTLSPDLPMTILPMSIARLFELRQRFEELHSLPSRSRSDRGW